MAARVQKLANKTHKDRVNEFNSKLEALSEHHDIPKASQSPLHALMQRLIFPMSGRARIKSIPYALPADCTYAFCHFIRLTGLIAMLSQPCVSLVHVHYSRVRIHVVTCLYRSRLQKILSVGCETINPITLFPSPPFRASACPPSIMKATAANGKGEKKGHVCPPSSATHPRDRWESLFVYAFICKFTNLRSKVDGFNTPMECVVLLFRNAGN